VDDSRTLFNDLTESARHVKPSYYFTLRALLQSRVDLDESFVPEGDDEDAGIYLEHLRRAFDDPAHRDEATPYLHRYDRDAFGRLGRAADARLTYKIYKTDTDFLLVSLGVFENPNLALMNRVPPLAATYRRSMEPTEDVVMGRGRTFYRFSYQYSQLVSRPNPVITEVLERLARGFDRYTRVLGRLRGEYTDIVHALAAGEVYHLEQTVDSRRQREILQERQDAFLDAYSAWRQSFGADDRRRLETAVEALKAVDSEFDFDFDEAAEEQREAI
jgi:hypothetical protein